METPDIQKTVSILSTIAFKISKIIEPRPKINGARNTNNATLPLNLFILTLYPS